MGFFRSFHSVPCAVLHKLVLDLSEHTRAAAHSGLHELTAVPHAAPACANQNNTVNCTPVTVSAHFSTRTRIEVSYPGSVVAVTASDVAAKPKLTHVAQTIQLYPAAATSGAANRANGRTGQQRQAIATRCCWVAASSQLVPAAPRNSITRPPQQNQFCPGQIWKMRSVWSAAAAGSSRGRGEFSSVGGAGASGSTLYLSISSRGGAVIEIGSTREETLHPSGGAPIASGSAPQWSRTLCWTLQ